MTGDMFDDMFDEMFEIESMSSLEFTGDEMAGMLVIDMVGGTGMLPFEDQILMSFVINVTTADKKKHQLVFPDPMAQQLLIHAIKYGTGRGAQITREGRNDDTK